MTWIIIYIYPWVTFDLFCPFLSWTLLGHGSRLTNAPAMTAEKCYGQDRAARGGGMYQMSGCGQNFLGWWLDLIILEVSSNPGNSKIKQVLVHQPQKPHQSGLFKNRNEPECHLFPLLYWLRLSLKGRKSKMNGKVQKLLYLFKVWKEAERCCIFIWMFSEHLCNHVHLMRLRVPGRKPCWDFSSGFQSVSQALGYFRVACLLWPSWGCCLFLHRIES